jgi:hypothetical protein
VTTARLIVPLNLPVPLHVEPGPDGAPAAVVLTGRRVAVSAALDSWRIDDEWWRTELSRWYWHVHLADGRPLTLFADLVGGGWYAQRYAAEPTIAVGA